MLCLFFSLCVCVVVPVVPVLPQEVATALSNLLVSLSNLTTDVLWFFAND